MLLAISGHLSGRRNLTLRQMTSEAIRVAGLPEMLTEAIVRFSDLRNKIVHGVGGIPDDETLRAIDLGILVLRLVMSAPRESYVVHEPEAPVFSDPEGVNVRRDVNAVILEVAGSNGSVNRRAYPTTQTYFAKGQQVSWEWNGSKTWGESWYRDPDSGTIVYGWTSSSEFVGRPLQDIFR
jgi:hypothetical protein